VGYPALAVLMIKGILPFNETLSEKFKGIHWKQLNQENKNDFDKTVEQLFTLAPQREFEAFAQEVLAILNTLTLHRPNDIPKPPSEW
jgi:hypothetical protein